jgi:hypothetical protein
MKKRPGRSVSGMALEPDAMKLFLVLLAAAGLGVLPGQGAQEEAVTYYVQLVRGTDQATPPSPHSKAIGPKLSSRLRTVFRWGHYWEICQHEVRVMPGHSTRLNLNNERQVEILRGTNNTRKVTAFHRGKALTTLTAPAGEDMTILGGDREGQTSWFIVVRRDKPTVE